MLELVFRDDGYNPAAAEDAVRELLDVQVRPSTAPKCPTTATPLVAGQTPVETSAIKRGPDAVLEPHTDTALRFTGTCFAF